MATAEMTQGLRTRQAAEPELAGLARDLSILAVAISDYPGAIEQMARGFQELSDLARLKGEKRIHMAARAFISILNRMDRAPEGDAPFILDTAIAFLDSVRMGCASKNPRAMNMGAGS